MSEMSGAEYLILGMGLAIVAVWGLAGFDQLLNRLRRRR
jgi:hypothetical protein